MGVEDMLVVLPTNVDGRLSLLVFPQMFLDLDLPIIDSPAPGNQSLRFMELLAEGLEVNPDDIWLTEGEIRDDVYENCMAVSPEELHRGILRFVRRLKRFYDGSKEPASLADEVRSASSIQADYLFAKKYVPPQIKEKYTGIVERLMALYSRRIEALDWMSEATKAFAQEKLAAMQACVACPDEWFPEAFPTLEEVSACNSFLEEYLLLRSRKLAYTLKLAGKDWRTYRMMSPKPAPMPPSPS